MKVGTSIIGPPVGDRILTAADIGEMLGKTRSAVARLLTNLEAQGLRRKGNGRSVHYLASQFWEAYRELDTRP